MQDTVDSLFGNDTKEKINYTVIETQRLQSLFAKYRNILLCKKTDGTTNRLKEAAWNMIKKEFNADGDTPRTVKQLKYKFENMKRVAKKKASKKRQEMNHSGGSSTDSLRSMLPSIDENRAVYDEDSTYKNPLSPEEEPDFEIVKVEMTDVYSEENHHEQQHVVEPQFENNVKTERMSDDGMEDINHEQLIPEIEMTPFETSIPTSSRRRPESSSLKRRVRKRKPTDNCNLVQKLLREKQEMELQRTKDSIRHAQEIHEQAMRHNEERHKLQLEKLNLEILLLTKKHLTNDK